MSRHRKTCRTYQMEQTLKVKPVLLNRIQECKQNRKITT
jgi:hypothetical protein